MISCFEHVDAEVGNLRRRYAPLRLLVCLRLTTPLGSALAAFRGSFPGGRCGEDRTCPGFDPRAGPLSEGVRKSEGDLTVSVSAMAGDGASGAACAQHPGQTRGRGGRECAVRCGAVRAGGRR